MPAARKTRARKRRLSVAASQTQTAQGSIPFEPNRSKLRVVIAAALLCVLTMGVYANSISNGFVWDDHKQVVMNKHMRAGASLGPLFSAPDWGFTQQGSHPQSNYYRPLQMLTYRVVAAAFGLQASAFHSVSLVLHIIAVLLAFAIFFELTGRIGAAFAAAALFALHPIHSEAVDWVSALNEIGCTVFLLFAFLFFCLTQRAVTDAADRSRRRMRALAFTVSSLAFAAALLWKETAIIFPLLVATYVFCMSKEGSLLRRIGDAAKPSLPYWSVLGAYLFLRFRVLGFVVTSQRNWGLTHLQLALTIPDLVLRYWLKLLMPIHLNAYYVFLPARDFSDPRSVAAILFVILALSVLVYSRQRAPLAAFASLWVFVTLIPVLNVYAVGHNVFTERYLYLPSVGFCLFMVLLAEGAAQSVSVRFRATISASALIIVLIFFAAQTISRNPDWKDDSSLFTRTLESSPNAPFVQNMVAAMQTNDPAGQASAEDHYLKGISLAENEIPPNRWEIAVANAGLASIYATRGDFDRALRTLDQVRIADPANPEVDGEEGLILVQAGRWAEAEVALRKAIAIDPRNENALNALGLMVWQHENHLDEAADFFARALAIHTDVDDFNASVHSNLGAVYGEQRRFSDAISQFEIAVRISPTDPGYLTNLAAAFAAIGRISDARANFEAALAVAPDYGPARDGLQRLPHP